MMLEKGGMIDALLRSLVLGAAGGGGYFSRETSDVVAAYALPGR